MTTQINIKDSSIDFAHPRYKPKAIVFDLLTGLLDSWTLWESSIGPEASCFSGREWRQRYLEITFKQGRYTPYEALLYQSAQDVGLPPSAPHKLLQSWQQLRPWPEVPEVLASLKKSGFRLAVVTNCSDVLGRRAVTSLCDYVHRKTGNDFDFDIVVTAEESGWYKPEGEAYNAALKALRLPPEGVLFVAGSAGDVEGATRAGMRVVWNNRVGLSRKGNTEPWKEGKNLAEVLEAVLTVRSLYRGAETWPY